jgi:ABC-type multidrug transport system fused ATPase/permease subunit
VAHRVASLVDFDQVAVFGGGQLVELGNAQELLLQGSSTFAQLLHSA